jgi:hypothetical protein
MAALVLGVHLAGCPASQADAPGHAPFRRACPPSAADNCGYYPTRWRPWPATAAASDDIPPPEPPFPLPADIAPAPQLPEPSPPKVPELLLPPPPPSLEALPPAEAYQTGFVKKEALNGVSLPGVSELSGKSPAEIVEKYAVAPESVQPPTSLPTTHTQARVTTGHLPPVEPPAPKYDPAVRNVSVPPAFVEPKLQTLARPVHIAEPAPATTRTPPQWIPETAGTTPRTLDRPGIVESKPEKRPARTVRTVHLDPPPPIQEPRPAPAPTPVERTASKDPKSWTASPVPAEAQPESNPPPALPSKPAATVPPLGTESVSAAPVPGHASTLLPGEPLPMSRKKH